MTTPTLSLGMPQNRADKPNLGLTTPQTEAVGAIPPTPATATNVSTPLTASTPLASRSSKPFAGSIAMRGPNGELIHVTPEAAKELAAQGFTMDARGAAATDSSVTGRVVRPDGTTVTTGFTEASDRTPTGTAGESDFAKHIDPETGIPVEPIIITAFLDDGTPVQVNAANPATQARFGPGGDLNKAPPGATQAGGTELNLPGAASAAGNAAADAATAVKNFFTPGAVDIDLSAVPVAGIGGGAPGAGAGAGVSGAGSGVSGLGGGGAIQGGVVAERLGRPTLENTGGGAILAGALGAQDQTRQGQLRSLTDLEAASRGEVASAAELQSRRDIQRAIAGQHALAASARGGAGAQALAQRAALSNAARLTADQAGQAAILRAREQDQARRTLANALGTARGQDVAVGELGQRAAAAQLGADVDVARANQAASLQAQEANLDARLRELGINTQLLTARERNQLMADLQAQDLQTEVALRNAGLLRDDRDALLGGTAGLLKILGLG